MSFSRILPVAGLLVLVSGIAGHVTAGPDETTGYNLLRLGGTWVKWGEPKLGTHAEVTYAFASRSMHFPDARNCRRLQPIAPMLGRLGIAADSFRDEVELAFGEWSRAADIVFRQIGDATEADIVIGAQKTPRGRAYSNVAYASRNEKGTTPISKSLICLNPAMEWKQGFDGDLDVYDLRYTLIHEIGHAIGLDHPGPHGQLMSFSYREDFRKLQAGDIAGAAALYGGPRNRTARREQSASGAQAAASGSTVRSAPQDLSLGGN